MTSRSFCAVRPRYALGPPRANIGPVSGVFLWFQVFPSTHSKEARYLRPHCTSCQDKIDQVLIWSGTLSRKKNKTETSPVIKPCGTPKQAEQNATHIPSSVSSRQDLPRSQCSLEKMSLGRSRHDFKTQAREELWIELSLYVFLRTTRSPLSFKHMCQVSSIFWEKNVSTCSLHFRNPTFWHERNWSFDKPTPVPRNTDSQWQRFGFGPLPYVALTQQHARPNSQRQASPVFKKFELDSAGWQLLGEIRGQRTGVHFNSISETKA